MANKDDHEIDWTRYRMMQMGRCAGKSVATGMLKSMSRILTRDLETPTPYFNEFKTTKEQTMKDGIFSTLAFDISIKEIKPDTKLHVAKTEEHRNFAADGEKTTDRTIFKIRKAAKSAIVTKDNLGKVATVEVFDDNGYRTLYSSRTPEDLKILGQILIEASKL